LVVAGGGWLAYAGRRPRQRYGSALSRRRMRCRSEVRTPALSCLRPSSNSAFAQQRETQVGLKLRLREGAKRGKEEWGASRRGSRHKTPQMIASGVGLPFVVASHSTELTNAMCDRNHVRARALLA